MLFDSNIQLKDAGLVASSAAGQVDSENQVVNLGEGRVDGFMVIDVSALEIASNNELYKIKLQGCHREDFAHGYEDLAILELGAKEVLGGQNDSAIGRYVVPFCNVKGAYLWPYVRVYCTVSGSIASGINYSAWLTSNPRTGTTSISSATTTTSTTSTTVTTTT